MIMNNPLISVVIPCYNVENYIEDCLDSVYAQSYKEMEVIAVDNNSNDQTLEKLKAYQQKYPDLIVLQEAKQGAPAARNKGLYHATGEWIQFLDADDLLQPNKIAHQIALCRKFACSFIASAYVKKYLTSGQKEIYIPNQNNWINLIKGQLGITSSNLFNKNALYAIDGWNEKLESSQEADLMFRLLKQGGNVVVDNQPLTIIQQRESGQISNGSVENMIRFTDIRLQILDYLNREMPQTVQENLNDFYDTIYTRSRMIAPFDVEKAHYYYRQLPATFSPNTMKAKLYKKAIDAFGFKTLSKFLDKRL